MSLTVEISTVVAGIAESLGIIDSHSSFELNGNTYSGKGLLFSFDVHMADFEDGYKFKSSRSFIGIVIAGHRVWIKRIDFGDHRESLLSPDGYVNTCNHDSCWRTEGIHNPLSNLYFRMADEVNEERINFRPNGIMRSYKKIAPKDISEYTFSPLVGEMLIHVDVKWKKIPDNPYKYELIEIESKGARK